MLKASREKALAERGTRRMIYLGSGDCARRLGVSVQTLHQWHIEGRLIPAATDSKRRRLYTEEQIADFAAQRETVGKKSGQ